MNRIESQTIGMDEITRKDGANGEPTPRLTPSDFQMYRAALEQSGVSPQEARRAAAKSRLLHARNSMARAKALNEIAQCKTPNAIIHAGYRIDKMVSEGVKGSLIAIGAISPEKTLEPVRINTASEPTVVYSRNK